MRPVTPGSSTVLRWLTPGLCTVVLACLALLVILTLHWPLVGDAVSVHYLILLLDHGMAPYRQIVDAQMPGTYLVDWAALHVFGGSAIGLRLFDYFLSLVTIVSMLLIAWPQGTVRKGLMAGDNRFAAFLAGGLFVLVHGRDGIEQSGQRDLIMAALLMLECASVFQAWRRHSALLLAIAGLCAATAISIKPTIFPAAFIILLLSLLRLKREGRSVLSSALAIFTGMLIPVSAVLMFLLHEKALRAFLEALVGMWPYYARLQPLPITYLVYHSISPMLPLVCVGVILCLLQFGHRRSSRVVGDGEGRNISTLTTTDWERLVLYSGLVCSLFSFVAQRKGFVYHRYPFLAFLLLILLLEFNEAWHTNAADSSQKPSLVNAIRFTGMLGCAVAALALAPICIYKVSLFDWRNDDYYRHLSQELKMLGGTALSGHVQCLDAFSGCISTLYRDNLVQSTGFLVDFYLFTPGANGQQPDPVVVAMRQQFWSDVQANPPTVFIVSKQVFPGGPSHPDTYQKLTWWPQFDHYLQSHYELKEEWSPGREVLWSSHPQKTSGYRIYVLRPSLDSFPRQIDAFSDLPQSH